jgi:carboxypeptidase family protein
MTRFFSVKTWGVFALAAVLVATLAVLAPQPAAAQATVATGSIQGTISDPAGAAVPGAKITVTGKDTGQAFHLLSTPTGSYNTGPVVPGNYVVRVEVPNFKTAEVTFVVQVGVITPGNIALQVGAQATVVEVTSAAVAVNSEQASIQGVLSTEQIENLPVNGRNFLDLAQLEPGVQIQDGTNFDPTKTGYSSISFGGRFGRTARIEVNGVDVSDETVGTTTANIPSSAIKEFQIAQSTLDLSNELTSSGAVNVVTQSGTTKYHGQGFDLYRNNKMAAGLPASPGLRAPFERSQFGGNFGGPVPVSRLRDKLFFFMDAERTVQNLQAPVSLSAPIQSLSGNEPSPFREGDAIGRLDYNGPHGLRMFYYFSYFKNKGIGTLDVFGGTSSYQIFKNVDQTRQHVVGAEFTTGSYTHSFRFSYLKFQNNIFDAAAGSGLPLANFPVSITLGTLATGPNLLAPQGTPQSNRQFKYDGSRIWGGHIIRYGFDFNHIQGGGFASFNAITPQVATGLGPGQIAFADSQVGVAGCPAATTAAAEANPLCYPMDFVEFGNGVGFSTTQPAFGFPFGGLGPDNRIGAYLGDSWKARRNLTITAGVRYVRDTGRTDSDLAPIQAINNVLPGFGNRVDQRNTNLAPQLGIAWDVRSNAKTVIRAGVGLFYENVIYNNVLFDRPPRLTNGAFLSFPAACSGGSAFPITFGPNGPNAGQSITIDQFLGTPGTCAQNIGAAGANLLAFQQAFIRSNGVDPTTLAITVPLNPNNLPPNPSFVGTNIANGVNTPLGLFAPGYKTPYAFQFNIGVQREIRPGMVLSADYVRNVGLRYLLSQDANHGGDVAFLNSANALAAITATNASFGCAAGTAGIPCAIAAGAIIDNYALNGLDSPGDAGGTCPAALGTAAPCAFGGINPSVGQLPFLFPIGRSVYNALQVKLVENVEHPFRGARHLNLQVSYALSRLQNAGAALGLGASEGPSVADQDFVLNAIDNRNALRSFGDSVLDRRNQLSFGGIVEVPLGFRLGFIAHFWSPLPSTLYVPFTGDSAGEIFRTDFTGDGTVQDVLPGTHVGSFGRDISNGNINNAINNFDNNVAGHLTPAGQALVNMGLFTPAQLGVGDASCLTTPVGSPTPTHSSLCAVAPLVPRAPQGEVGTAPLKAFDLKIGWHHSFRERVTVEPSIGFYNLFNFANFDLPTSTLSGSLTGSPGSVNGTLPQDRLFNRVGIGSGVFSLGAPRTIEVGMKISF